VEKALKWILLVVLTLKSTDVSNTPRQNNFTVPKETIPNNIIKVEDTDGSITTDGLEEINDLTEDIPWVNIEETQEFYQVHYYLFDTVNTWVLQENAKNHPFYCKWQKAIYAGLTALTKWDRVAKVLYRFNE
jgi:hypothetical protein